MLDTAQELQSLQKTLRESGRKLLFRAEVATVRNFRFLVRMLGLIYHVVWGRGRGGVGCGGVGD